MLSSYRVLDFTDERGMFCGYILAHLGADVVAVEPPGGWPARDGLWWRAYARGKRNAAVDLSTDLGRARLLELAAEADFLIESLGRDDARRLGLEPEAVASANPGLIHANE